MSSTRRSILGLMGAAPLAASGVLAAGGPAYADAGSSRLGKVLDGLKPGGALDQFVAAQAAGDEFSGSLLLTYRGRAVLARSYGLADKLQAVPNGPNTRFALASVTKLFTAVAIAQLAQRGKMGPPRSSGRSSSPSRPAPATSTATRATTCSAQSWRRRPDSPITTTSASASSLRRA